jgi:hypothetical protein
MDVDGRMKGKNLAMLAKTGGWVILPPLFASYPITQHYPPTPMLLMIADTK